MSENRSARLALPLLQPGQAQKEIDHNEALTVLDIATQAAVVAIGLDTPPVAPADGACWIVGTSPIGAWSGQADAIAGWTSGGWRFVTARAGMTVWSVADDVSAAFDGTTWTVGDVAAARLVIGGQGVVGARKPAIANPSGGITSDTEARGAIDSILSALRDHGLIAP